MLRAQSLCPSKLATWKDRCQDGWRTATERGGYGADPDRTESPGLGASCVRGGRRNPPVPLHNARTPSKVGGRAKVSPGDQIRVTAAADDGQLINWSWSCTAAGRTSRR
jgi:hypothetical protein